MERPLSDPSLTPAEQEALWDLYRRHRQDRRRFLELLAVGGAAAVLSACRAAPQGGSVSAQEPPAFFKDTTPFIQHGATNLEARLENLGGFLTPNDLFFVRNNARSLDVDAASYQLAVAGDAVTTPLRLSYDDLLDLPSHTVFSYIECGGNQRAFFGEVLGQAARGTQWRTGAIGMAGWTGVSLAEVLTRAGVRDDAVDVQLIGLDDEAPEGGFRRPIPIDKALDPDTILAYRMNGAVLPRDHGYPVRAIVPGWVGSTNIKWLGRIEVSTQRVWSRNNTSSYVLIGEDYPPEGDAQGQVATLQSIKSALMLPWPGVLAAGSRRIRGYAHSPHAPIQAVEWSDDGGQTWNEAAVLDPLIKYAWARFEFIWEARPGEQTLMTRATDQAGHTQPSSLPMNEKGYLFNLPLPHPVQVG